MDKGWDTFNKALHFITAGFHGISSAVTKMFGSFKSAVDIIIPRLSQEERKQLNDAFDRYTKFLMSTQSFISCTKIGVRYAETIQHLCEAVPIEQLKSLISDVQKLLNEFRNLEMLVKDKLRDDHSITNFRNIMLGVCGLGVGIALIATGVGGVAGFGIAAKCIIGLGITAGAVGAGGAAIAHSCLQVSDIGKVLKSLEELQKCLNEIAQDHANMEGMHNGINNLKGRSREQEIRIVAEQREEFQHTLDKAQDEVTKGFEILKKH